MSGDDPAYLPIGSEVSAKYKGAFCEAKVKIILKNVKVKVHLKESNSNIFVTDEEIKGPLKVGLTVAVKLESGQYTEATISKITDSSTYTVVFDDGDENTLRRSQLCPKGEKHFVQSETLDQLPLTHPEHFGTPVVQTKKRKRQHYTGELSDYEEEESSSDENQRRVYRGRLQDMVGRVLSVEVEERKKTCWLPVLVIDPNADPLELKSRDHLLVRSFKDSKFHAVSKRDAKDFNKEVAAKNEDKTLKIAFERAVNYIDNGELPPNWDKAELLGSETETESGSESSDDEPSEEKDHFVAQLYKFMDDRGTPINKAPVIGGKDLNLYKLFRVVQNIGGYNKVTNQNKWRQVYDKLSLPPSTAASAQIKNSYKKFLHAFEDFYRKLGSTMGTISRPSRSRHSSSGRSLLSFRDRESPKSPRTERKAKDDIEKKEDPQVSETSDISDVAQKDKVKPVEKEKLKATDKEKVLKTEPKEKVTKSNEKISKNNGKVTEREKSTRIVDREKPSKPAPPDLIPEAHKKTRTRLKEDKTIKEDKDQEKTSDEPSQRVTRESKNLPPVHAEFEFRTVKKEPEIRISKKEQDESKIMASRRQHMLKEDAKPPSPASDDGKQSKSKTKRKIPPRIPDEGAEESDDKIEESDSDSIIDYQREKRKKVNPDDFPLGSRLKVKYGKGKNQKLYEAKVIEAESEIGVMHYLVHYAGWNNRYDEWVKKDRILSVLEEGPRKTPCTKPSTKMTPSGKPPKPPVTSLSKPVVTTPSPKPVCSQISKAVTSVSRSTGTVKNPTVAVSKPSTPVARPCVSLAAKPVSTTPVSKPQITQSPSADSESVTITTLLTPSKIVVDDSPPTKKRPSRVTSVQKTPSAAPLPATQKMSPAPPVLTEVKDVRPKSSGKGSRLTRSSSTDGSLAGGLPVKSRLSRRNSGYTESSDKSSQMSDSEDDEDLDKDIAEECESNKDDSTLTEEAVDEDLKDEPRKPVLQAIAEMSGDTKLDKAQRDSEEDIIVKNSEHEKTIILSPKGDSNRRSPHGDIEKKMGMKVLQVEVEQASPVKTQGASVSQEVKAVVLDVPEIKLELDIRSDQPVKIVPKKTEDMPVRTVDIADEKKDSSSIYDFHEERVEVSKIIRLNPKDLSEKTCSSEEVVSTAVSSSDNVASDEGKTDKQKPKRTKKESLKAKAAKASAVILSEEKNTQQDKISSADEADPTIAKSESPEIDVTTHDVKEEKLKPAQKKRGRPEKSKREKVKARIRGDVDGFSEDKDELDVLQLQVKRKVRRVKKKPQDQEDKNDSAFSSGQEDEVSKPKKPRMLEATKTSSELVKSHDEDDSQIAHQQATHDAAQVLLHMPTSSFSMAPMQHIGSMHRDTATTVFDNTPPDTPERSTEENSGDSPSHSSFRSDREANIEVEVLTDPAASSTGGESPNDCYGSIESNASGSDNIPVSESSSDLNNIKRKPVPEEQHPPKRRKRGHRRSGKHKHTAGSDSDDNNAGDNRRHSSPTKRLSSGSLGAPDMNRPPRPSKYNFLDLEEGKYLEREERIHFLSDKIQDLRKIYMQLKQEVACIDRRRKRARRREREAAQAIAAQQQAALMNEPQL